jgi:putative drug exporter of the RND superfamily
LGIAIFVTLLSALTLAPALASAFGNKLFWPRRETLKQPEKPRHPGFWDRVARISTGRPLIVGGVVIIIMLLPYLALPNLNRSFDQLAEIPSSSESVKGFKILQQHYDIGEMDPMTVMIVAPVGQNLTSPAALESLTKISADLRKVNGVEKCKA